VRLAVLDLVVAREPPAPAVRPRPSGVRRGRAAPGDRPRQVEALSSARARGLGDPVIVSCSRLSRSARSRSPRRRAHPKEVPHGVRRAPTVRARHQHRLVHGVLAAKSRQIASTTAVESTSAVHVEEAAAAVVREPYDLRNSRTRSDFARRHLPLAPSGRTSPGAASRRWGRDPWRLHDRRNSNAARWKPGRVSLTDFLLAHHGERVDRPVRRPPPRPCTRRVLGQRQLVHLHRPDPQVSRRRLALHDAAHLGLAACRPPRLRPTWRPVGPSPGHVVRPAPPK
jgi:hypothetical protein